MCILRHCKRFFYYISCGGNISTIYKPVNIFSTVHMKDVSVDEMVVFYVSWRRQRNSITRRIFMYCSISAQCKGFNDGYSLVSKS
jgi:hypothetical protein